MILQWAHQHDMVSNEFQGTMRALFEFRDLMPLADLPGQEDIEAVWQEIADQVKAQSAT